MFFIIPFTSTDMGISYYWHRMQVYNLLPVCVCVFVCRANGNKIPNKTQACFTHSFLFCVLRRAAYLSTNLSFRRKENCQDDAFSCVSCCVFAIFLLLLLLFWLFSPETESLYQAPSNCLWDEHIQRGGYRTRVFSQFSVVVILYYYFYMYFFLTQLLLFLLLLFLSLLSLICCCFFLFRFVNSQLVHTIQDQNRTESKKKKRMKQQMLNG